MIKELGGAVFPKLNWSSPKVSSSKNVECSLRGEREKEIKKVCFNVGPKKKNKNLLSFFHFLRPQDAVWISTTGSLKCVTPGDVFLLLKSSDNIMHDLTMAFEGCEGEKPEVEYEVCEKKRRKN